jgi:copper chaperone NosL
MNAQAHVSLALLAALALGACAGAGPRAVVLDEDQCGVCRMEISDARFATQVVTRTGKSHVFDSVECLASYLRGTPGEEKRTVWVADAERPEQWVAAEEAGYLLGSELRGPMGHVVAFASPEAASAARSTLGGTTVSWGAILADSAGITAHMGH